MNNFKELKIVYLCFMKEEEIERKLKAELDFFKVYAVFIIGLITGNVNLFNNFIAINEKHTFILLSTGAVFMIFMFGMILRSFYKIKKLTNN